MLRFLAVCLAGLSGSLWAAPLPPAPADGIRDNAHALDDALHARLAAEVRQFQTESGIQLWLCAVTFVPDSQPLRQYARELRQGWSGGGDAILLAYDRVSDGQSLSLSPSLWERYPSTDIILLMQQGATIMAAKDTPLEQRLEQSLRLTITRLRELESQRLRLSQLWPHSQRRFVQTAGIGIALGALAVFCLSSAARRRDSSARQQLVFPKVQVATRFGAPHGGGVIVQCRDIQ